MTEATRTPTASWSLNTSSVSILVTAILNRVERTHSHIARLVSSGNTEEAPVGFHDEALTDAESRVALAVSRGLSNKEIAAELEISVRTVENHISHILDKKGFSNRVEIARYVFEQPQKGTKDVQETG